MNAIERDVHCSLAARFHADAERCDKDGARRHGTSRRSHNRWTTEGTGSPADRFGRFVLMSRDPHRAVAHVRSLAFRASIEKATRSELIARYRDLVKLDKVREAEDTVLHLTPAASWLEKAAASERDSAVDEEKAAIERRFAEMRPPVTHGEVWG